MTHSMKEMNTRLLSDGIKKDVDDNRIVYYKNEVEILLKEIARLREKCDRQAHILRRLTPESYPGTMFISGVLGKTDQNRMPEKLLIVPGYGVEFAYVYERTDKTFGAEW